MNEDKLLARMRAVKGIAKRTGYPEYVAEDISQHVAINGLSGRRLETQSAKQTFIDALREGSERAYTRRGQPIVPLFEGHFEDFEALQNDGLRCDFDFGNFSEDTSDIYDIVSAISELKTNRIRAMILYFYYEWSLDKISNKAGVSESRISQLIADALKQIKAKVISSRVSSEKHAERKRAESRLLQQSEGGSKMGGEKKKEMARVLSFKGAGMVSYEIKKIPEELCESFTISTF